MACTLPFGMIIFCAGRIISSIVCLFFNTYYTGKLISCGFVKQMIDLAPAFFLSFSVFLISFGMTYLFENLWFQLIIGCISGVVFYIGVAFSLKMDELQDIKYLLKLKS